MANASPPALDDYVLADELADLIRRARAEDLGPDGIDVTSALFIPADLTACASVVARKPGYLAGASLLNRVVNAYDPHISVEIMSPDGSAIKPGQTVATLTGPLRSILTAERVALNFMTMLSGVATLTARYVEETTGTRAKVYDTRKTLPGLRGLQKYAVACGGGATHRMGLYDAVLLKDNHLAHVDADNLTMAVAEAVLKCRSAHPGLKFVMIEVDTLAQLDQVLPTGIDIVLLDNMTTAQLTQAVKLRDKTAPKVELEASGGVTLDTIRAIAQTGMDRISVGALTHSAPALDLGLDIAR
ncbi:MAG: carboxylating nicotinate-nucleotide diphosphorylase [Phycisphaerales bacterium]